MKRYKYNGKERDDETGLDYYGARYYASWLCRFISVDPQKDNYPMQNSFAYAANSPVTMVDVNGESPNDPGGEDDMVVPAAKDKDGNIIPSVTLKEVEIVAKSPIPEADNEIKANSLKGIIIKETSIKGSAKLLDNMASAIENKNRETGKKVDNFGTERQSPRKYEDPTLTSKKLNGESEWIDIGGESKRGKFSTSANNFQTKNVKLYKSGAKLISEFAGPLADLVDLVEVLRKDGNPFTLLPGIGTIAGIHDAQLDDLNIEMFEFAISQGYGDTYNMLQNSPGSGDFLGELDWLYVSDSTVSALVNGDETLEEAISNNIASNEYNSNNAILVAFDKKNKPSVVATFFNFEKR